MLDKLKKIFSVKRLVWFTLISGLFLVFYTPHLKYQVELQSVTSGDIVLANYNTDRGEEIFETYNYSGHKTWVSVMEGDDYITVDSLPIVTNSLQMKLQNLSEMTAKKITISFGPFVLKEYTAENISEHIAGSQGLDISLENSLIHLTATGNEGWITFDTEEYLSHMEIFGIYILVLLMAWIITVILDHTVEQINRIPLNEVMLISGPCWIFFISEAVLGNIFYIALGMRLLNVLLLIVLYKALFLIFRRRPMGYNIANLIVVLYAIASTFVVRFRNRPIEPWDFSALSTAMDVASNYDLSINYMMVIAIIVCAILYLIMRKCPRSVTRVNKYYTVYPIIIIVLAIFFNSIGSYYLWDVRLLNTFQTEGTALSFTGLVRQFINDQPKKPEGYSKEKLKKIKAQMEQLNEENKPAEDAVKPTNIIMVMNESFSNLDVGGTNYAEGMTPYFDSLDNTIRGNLYVSVRGGGTCNSEYETLTGNTTSFFSAGVYPYNQYMNRDVPSLVSYMNENGYETTGMHLGKSTNWNRRTAYQKLAFDNTVFAETFDGLDTIHGYPTDKQDFEKVIENYEKNKGKNQFLFNVTYQNHGSYNDAHDLKKTVNLGDEYGYDPYSTAENYLSLIKLTDEAFKDLVEYFKNVDEPTMIIMFGDHQPSLGNTSNSLFFPDSGTPEKDINQYITPFLIWANYDIPDQTIDKMSANYLSALIVNTANMEMTPYQRFLFELMKKYPVISLYGCYDSNGTFYNSVDDIDDESIQEYRMLQYNNVFDSARMEDLFWPSGYDDHSGNNSD